MGATRALAGLVAAAAVLGCAAATPPAAAGAGDGEPAACDVKRVGLDPGKFYLYLTDDTPFWKWERLPGTGPMQPGQGFHGAFGTAYANPAAVASIRAGTGLAAGSLLVLETFDRDRQPRGICAMLRIRGFEPGAGDWHWFQYDAQGNAVVSGRADACVACHAEGRDNDYVLSAPVRGREGTGAASPEPGG